MELIPHSLTRQMNQFWTEHKSTAVCTHSLKHGMYTYRHVWGLQFQPQHVFGMWEQTGTHRENADGHKEDVQTLHSKYPTEKWPGKLSMLGTNVNHYTSVPFFRKLKLFMFLFSMTYLALTEAWRMNHYSCKTMPEGMVQCIFGGITWNKLGHICGRTPGVCCIVLLRWDSKSKLILWI